eukprot:3762145-Pleurochrysis_carterae.AAC.1
MARRTKGELKTVELVWITCGLFATIVGAVGHDDDDRPKLVIVQGDEEYRPSGVSQDLALASQLDEATPRILKRMGAPVVGIRMRTRRRRR